MHATSLPALADILTGLSNAIFQIGNSLCGRSEIFDTWLALSTNNPLVKAGVIGGCLVAAWLTAKDDAALRRARKILLLTFLAAALAAGATKSLSRSIFLPRPFIQSQKAFHLDGDQLVESPRVVFRAPLDEESQKDYRNLLAGNFLPNDLGSFPSDHASFYVALAAGTWLASRSPGGIALAWTFLVILGSRVISGMHSPLDIAAGAGIGILALLGCHWILGKWFRRQLDAIVDWTVRHPALSAALIFAAAFEAVSTLENLRHLLQTVATVGKHLIAG